MKLYPYPYCLFLCLLLFSCYTGTAQINTLFDSSKQFRTLNERWELDSTSQKGTFLITPYKSIYILPTRWSSKPNEKPFSDNPQNVSPEAVDYNNLETKFQISFKTKIFQGLFFGQGDLWVGYTQKASWQLYNKSLSRPFRELNYEPEVILNFATDFNVFGLRNKMLGISFNHESNGRGMPLSRSWNRIILQAGLEKGNWSVYLRPWYRLPDTEDDNPNISKYMGRGDLTVIYIKNANVLSLMARHNLYFNSKSKGYLEFDWAYPISGNLKAHLQVSQGYGETLIDYNNRQTTIGLGVSLIEWL